MRRIYGFTSRNISDVEERDALNVYIRKYYGFKSPNFGVLNLWEISPKIDNQIIAWLIRLLVWVPYVAIR